MALTTEQIAEVNAAITAPVQEAIIGFLTAEPYSLTPEEATAAASEYTNAGGDAFGAYFGGDTEAEDMPAEEEAKAYKSKFAKSLVEKAGAKLSGATKAELAKAIEHAATVKDCSNVITKILKNLVETAVEDDSKSAIEGELKALRAEIETLKAAQNTEPSIEEFFTKALQDI